MKKFRTVTGQTMVLTMLMISGATWAEPEAGRASGARDAIQVAGSSSSIVIVNGKVVSGDGEAIVGKGPVKTEERRVGAFEAVVVEGPVELSFRTARTVSVKVTAQANVIPAVTTDVHGTQLVLGVTGTVSSGKPIAVAITGPTPVLLRLSGSGSITAVDLDSKSMALDIEGSGDIRASGKVANVTATISGSGSIYVGDLKAAVLRAEISGSGDIEAYASKAVTAEISGSGGVKVAGNPPQRNIDISGAGDVTFE